MDEHEQDALKQPQGASEQPISPASGQPPAAAQAQSPEPQPQDAEVAEPEPVKGEHKALTVFATIAGVAIALTVLFPQACPLTATHGATRSAQLQWQQRHAQMERELAEIESGLPLDGQR
jgi:hypothetical protein